jgi:hypothetical protein
VCKDERPALEEGKEKPVKNIIELNDVIPSIEDGLEVTDDKNGKVLTESDRIYDLVDVIEEVCQAGGVDRCYDLNDEAVKKVSEIAEKVIREMVPGIAERIIREEIEKLKSGA